MLYCVCSEQMVKAAAPCIDYREAEDIVGSCKVEETFIEKHQPLPMDLNALVAEEEDIPKPMFEVIYIKEDHTFRC